MQTRARALSDSVETLDRRTTIEVYLDSTAHIVSGWTNGNVFLGNVYADGKALLVDVREMMLGFLGVFVRHVKANVIQAMNLHLLVNGACNDVAWCKR